MSHFDSLIIETDFIFALLSEAVKFAQREEQKTHPRVVSNTAISFGMSSFTVIQIIL